MTDQETVDDASKCLILRRRGRDSNPRHGETVYRISSPATNPVPLSTSEDRTGKAAPSRSKKARAAGQQRDKIPPAPQSLPNLRYQLIDANWGDRRLIPDHWNRHGRGEL